MNNSERQDIYARVTAKIIASLEQGVRPWIKPWNAENTAGRISRPLRHNGQPYSDINILMLWGASFEYGFTSPTWMTFRQAQTLNARISKGEKGSLVVYANTSADVQMLRVLLNSSKFRTQYDPAKRQGSAVVYRRTE